MNAVYSHSLHLRARLRAPLALALATALGVSIVPGLAQANTYVVTSNTDTGSGTCAVASCTLRDAVAAANLNTGADTITFASTLSGDTILLDIAGKGNIAITDSLTIQGPGANQLTVSGGGVATSHKGGIFEFTGSTLMVSGITLANGYTSDRGGALSFDYSGQLTLSGVAVLNSHAQLFGGGFYMGGGTLTVIDSTISGNSTNNHGGGFSIDYPTVSLVNCTISGNSANGNGGGIYGRTGSSNSLTIRNSTISGNSSSSKGGGFLLNKSNVTLTNSIVANNTAPTGAEFFGGTQGTTPTNVSANFSLIEGGYSVSGTFSGANNIFGQDPKLGPLAPNGGPTQTLALLLGSPAIDAGSNAFTHSTYDQRGPGFPRIFNGTIDIGAFENQGDRIFTNGFEPGP